MIPGWTKEEEAALLACLDFTVRAAGLAQVQMAKNAILLADKIKAADQPKPVLVQPEEAA